MSILFRPIFFTFLMIFVISNSILGQQGEYNKAITIKFVNENGLLDARQIKRRIAESIKVRPNIKKKDLEFKWERVFPPAGKFEEKHRAHGLHLWYRLRYDSAILENKDALELFKGNPQIEVTEFFAASSTSLPSDSLFGKQWNFYNTGQKRGSVGHDLEFLNSSKLESGDPRVVVSIHDSGIDLYNPELTANLWVNIGEIPDNEIDDDNNGYVDDVHGWGFGEQNKKLNDTHGHGSHISGVIAAKWDNKGVVGLAGGKGEDDGVRLMICRLDWDDPGLVISNPEESLIYAADNGAIISQNSWNTFSISFSVKAAVEYFTTESQNQMMNGGLVVFSAGNSGLGIPRYEASIPRVMMVGSIDNNSQLSYFSNYGTWVAALAPGSNVYSNGTFGNYMYMSGTSMAAPHVSGVAALVVSKFGNPHYTPDSVIFRIKESAVNIKAYNPFRYVESGRINAFKALLVPDSIAPSAAEISLLSVRAFDASIKWPSPFDNTISAFHYTIALRKNGEILTENFNQYIVDTLHIANPDLSDTLQYLFENLENNSNYSLAIKTFDYFMNEGEISNIITFQTQAPPKIEVNGFETNHQFHIDSSYQKKIVIKNIGSSELDWQISKTGNLDSSNNFSDLNFGIFSDLSLYPEVSNYIESEGGSILKLPRDFYESDLSGVQILIVESGILQLDSSKYDIIERWVQRGGNLILAISIYGTNSFVEKFGIDVKSYDPYKQETSEGLNRSHPITKNLAAIGFTFHDTYLEFKNSNLLPLVYDNSQNVCAAIGSHGKGKMLLVTSNFFYNFYINNEDNLQFAQNSIKWLSSYNSIKFSNWNGVISPNQSDTLLVEFNQNLGTTYQNGFYIHTNDPINNSIYIDYSLNISGYPILQQNVSCLNLDTLFVGFTKKSTISVSNKGTDLMHLYRKNGTPKSFDYSIDTINLNLGENQTINVHFFPSRSGQFSDTLTYFGNVKDTVKFYIKGYAQWPPLLELYPKDSLLVIQNDTGLINKSIYFGNIGLGIDLKTHLALRPIKLSNSQSASLQFKGKKIGVTNLSSYYNAFFYLKLESEGNEIFDFKTNPTNNVIPLAETDLVIMDYKIFSMSISNIDKIINWVRNGGSLLLQTDQNTDPEKLIKLFSEISVNSIDFYGSQHSDTLKDIILHPITENLESYFSSNHYSYLKTDDLTKVLIYDELGKPHISYDYIGKGKVIIAANDIFNVPPTISDIRLLIQSLNWLLKPEKPFWVDFKSQNFITPIGETESAAFAFHFDSIQYHEAGLEIRSNDPYQTSKSIKIILTSDTTISTDNHSPSFAYSPSEISVKENAQIGTILDTLKGLDTDGDFLYFSLLGQDNCVIINEETGVLSVQNSTLLNYEVRPIFDIMVSVSDKIDTSLISITINIENVNEAPQVVAQFLEMEEDENKEWQIDYEDPEGDSIAVEITLPESKLYSSSNWSWDLSTRTLALNPKANAFGETEINITLSDGHNATTFVLPITVNPINDVPDLSVPIDKILVLDSVFTEIISLSDVDSDSLFLGFSFSNSEVFRPLTPIVIINDLDSLNLDFSLNPIKKGNTSITLTLSDGKDSVNYEYNLEVKSLAEILAANGEMDGLSVYPNPLNNILKIDYKKEPLVGYSISDLLGRKVLSGRLDNMNYSQTLNLEKLPRGIYLLDLETQSGQIKQVRIIAE